MLIRRFSLIAGISAVTELVTSHVPRVPTHWRAPKRRSGPTAPAPCIAGLAKEVGHVAHLGDPQMLDGSRGGLADGGRHVRGAALGDYDARGAVALSRTAYRAKVLRVLYLVDCHDQWLLHRRKLIRY